MLKHEKYLYLTGSRPYLTSGETPDNIFIQNIEEIISSESKNWNQMNAENNSTQSSS